MAVLEKEIEKKLVAMAKRNGGLCLKWVCPGWLGVPDRICLFPRAQVVFVETKRPAGGKRSKMQQWWARKLSELGFLHLWVKCEDDIAALELLVQGEVQWSRPGPCPIAPAQFAAIYADDSEEGRL